MSDRGSRGIYWRLLGRSAWDVLGQSAVALIAGTSLGRYEIQSPLGAGGMGEVYLARDPLLGRTVAIKLLPTAFAGDPDRLRRRPL